MNIQMQFCGLLILILLLVISNIYRLIRYRKLVNPPMRCWN